MPPSPAKNQRPLRRPWTFVHVAMSADGKIATADRAPARFGSRTDHERLLAVRATADAILVGATTLAVEGTRMRLPRRSLQRWRRARGMSDEPVRAVLSGSLRFGGCAENEAPTAEMPIFRDADGGPPIVVFTSRRSSRADRGALAERARVLATPRNAPDPAWIAGILRAEYDVRRLLLEGGGGLNALFFEAGLVDEMFVTLCPALVGGRDAATPFDGTGFSSDGIRRGRLTDVERSGNELFLRYRFPTVTPPTSGPVDPPWPPATAA